MTKPLIAITMGDPCGIGPEIIIKALSHEEIHDICVPLVCGDMKRMLKLAERSNFYGYPKHYKTEFFSNVNCDPCHIGIICPEGGKAAYKCIKKATELALSGTVDAVVTAPINKEALRAAKVPYIGHTEIFAALTETDDPLTMFETLGLRVFFLTRHVSLAKACKMVTRERILDYIIRCTAALKNIGINSGTLAVAGLNPHCGEHGLFGNEEQEEILPAVEQARKMGYDVVGPISADSVFHLAKTGRYSAVLSLYHDQGHIATKTLDFERTIAITHGLPFLRTSVDHGTAFDIAGKNIASETSMVEAIKLAAKYCTNKK